MRILLVNTYIHAKNRSGLALMAAAVNAHYEISADHNVYQEEWDLVVIPSELLPASLFPHAKRIVYGPQNFVLPSQTWFANGHVFDSRCYYNCLSPWVKTLYEEVKQYGTFPLPFRCLPFAVDVNRFEPSSEPKTLDCFVYFKHREHSLLVPVIEALHRLNLRHVLFHYGSYSEDEYIATLHKAKFGIWIGSHESQGFAVQEALATNTPLLVLNASSMFDEYSRDNRQNYTDEKGKYQMKATSVPYWDSRCGILVENFEEDLRQMLHTWESFKPRDYILETLSPQVCIKRFLQLESE